MSEQTSVLSPVSMSRLRKRSVILGLSAGQVVVLATGGVVLLAALYVAGGAGVAWTSPVWGLALGLAYAPIAGRPAVEWAPTVAHWALRRAAGQTRFRRQITRPSRVGQLALPGDAARLRHIQDQVTGCAMIHDPYASTLTATLTISYPSFVLLDPADQERRVHGWGRVLAGLCRSPRIARLQVLERTVPDTGSGLATWWAEHGVDDGSWVAGVYRDLMADAGPAGERHVATVSLAIDLRTAARAVRGAGGGLQGAATVLRQEMSALSTALRAADLQPGRWCTPGEVAEIIRAAYDPAATAVLDQHPVGRDPATAGPIAIDEEWDRFHSDSAYHAVYWISEWPRAQTYPGFLGPLILTSGVRRSFTLLVDPIPAHVAARQIRKRKTGHLADSAQRARIGQLEDAAATAEYADTLQQEAELIEGHGALRYTGLVAVSSGSREELEAACAAVEHAALQSSCELRRLVGQQAQAFTAAALPFCRGL